MTILHQVKVNTIFKLTSTCIIIKLIDYIMIYSIYIVHVRFGPSQLSCLGSSVVECSV